MKLAQHTNTLETNVEVQSKNFSITRKGLSKIIGVLRNNLYTHKIRTSIQEYMSNARDAQREAGSAKCPVVTVPNTLNPVFKVRDFGPGMTPERIDNIFLNYGESTKEGSNTEAGGFGIGAKSAWAYTDSFTVVSWTGGVCRTYVAHTGRNNNGDLDLLTEEKSSEPNGVEIQIAVKQGDINAFRAAIWRACHFWKPSEYPTFKGVVAHEVPQRKASIRIGDLELINGLPSYLELDGNHYQEMISMVIDGIPYSMGKQFIASVTELRPLLQLIKCDALIHVGNGLMDIPASRESISTESINKEILAKMAPKLKEGLVKYIKDRFDKAKSYSSWIATYHELSEMLNVDGQTKRGGYSINGADLYSDMFKQFNMYEVGPGRRGGFKREPTTSIELSQLGHVFYIDDANETMAKQNRRLKEYLEKNSGTRRCILIQASEMSIMEIPTVTQTSGTKVVPNVQAAPVKKVLTTFAESHKAMDKVIKDLGGKQLSCLPYTAPVRAPKALRVKELEEFTIHRYRYGRKNIHTTTLKSVEANNDAYLYIPYSEWAKYKNQFGQMDNFVQSQGYQLCALTEKGIKQVAGHKLFKTYESWLAAYVPDAKIIGAVCARKAKNTPQMKLLLQATQKVMDPILGEMLEIYKTVAKINPEDVPALVLDTVSDQIKAFEKADAELTKLINESYPLINMIDRTGPTVANELVHYINAKA